MSEFKFLQLGDVRLRAAVQGSGPLVVMVHGFPESWFSWRHQMVPVADAGFTVHRLAVREIPRSGKPEELLDRYGISAAHIAEAVRTVTNAKPLVASR